MSNVKRHLLLTKPRGQNNELKAKLSELGFSVSVLACLEIEKINFTMPQIAPDSLVVFTSQNAVRFFDGDVSGSIFAIGPATQKSLEIKNIKAIIPVQFNSEGLLKLDALQNTNNKNVFIIGGENPRPLLADTLKQHGAVVNTVYCYRRIRPTYSIEEINHITQQSFNIIVSTSAESLNNLNGLLAQHADWLHSQPLLVISDKMKALATDLGFNSKIIVSENASNESIVDSLTTLYNRG